jgi:etoposide-induced 2.4 mRNA
MFNFIIQPLLNFGPSLQHLFSALYYILWVLPLYLVCLLMNIFWYQDIASSTYKRTYGIPKVPIISVSRKIAFEVHRFFIVLIFLGAICALNVIGLSFLSILLLSYLYSFYCFEYRWALEGMTLGEQLKALETNWAYYLGFGLVITLCTYYFPGLVGSGLWAALFPLFIVTAMTASPPTECRGRVRVFSYINKLVNWLEVLVLRRTSKHFNDYKPED